MGLRRWHGAGEVGDGEYLPLMGVAAPLMSLYQRVPRIYWTQRAGYKVKAAHWQEMQQPHPQAPYHLQLVPDAQVSPCARSMDL